MNLSFLLFLVAVTRDTHIRQAKDGEGIRKRGRGDSDRGEKEEGADEFYVSNSLSEPEPKLLFFVTVPSFIYITYTLVSREVQVPQKPKLVVQLMPKLNTKG